jgi:hypothetical protein
LQLLPYHTRKILHRRHIKLRIEEKIDIVIPILPGLPTGWHCTGENGDTTEGRGPTSHFAVFPDTVWWLVKTAGISTDIAHLGMERRGMRHAVMSGIKITRRIELLWCLVLTAMKHYVLFQMGSTMQHGIVEGAKDS